MGVRGAWWSVVPPPPDECAACGAIAQTDVIQMVPRPGRRGGFTNVAGTGTNVPLTPAPDPMAAAREIVRRHFVRWDANTDSNDDYNLTEGALCRSLTNAIAAFGRAQYEAGQRDAEGPEDDDAGWTEVYKAGYAAGVAAERARCAERIYVWLTNGPPKYFSLAEIKDALRVETS